MFLLARLFEKIMNFVISGSGKPKVGREARWVSGREGE